MICSTSDIRLQMPPRELQQCVYDVNAVNPKPSVTLVEQVYASG